MKKTISMLLVCALLVGCVFVLASCGAISGTYVDPTGNVSYKFSGSSVVKTTDNLFGDDTVEKGTYVVETDENDNKTITITFEGKDPYTVAYSSGTKDGKNFIVMGIITYTEKKD